MDKDLKALRDGSLGKAFQESPIAWNRDFTTR
jgi:hypothetical protein